MTTLQHLSNPDHLVYVCTEDDEGIHTVFFVASTMEHAKLLLVQTWEEFLKADETPIDTLPMWIQTEEEDESRYYAVLEGRGYYIDQVPAWD